MEGIKVEEADTPDAEGVRNLGIKTNIEMERRKGVCWTRVCKRWRYKGQFFFISVNSITGVAMQIYVT